MRTLRGMILVGAALFGSLRSARAQIPANCRPKDVPPIVKGQQASLAAGCRLGLHLSSNPNAEAWVDAWRLDLRGAGNFSVRASSTAFDAFLILHRPDGQVHLENDDAASEPERGESGLDAAIHGKLAEGVYYIFVTGKGGTGNYSLTTDFDGQHHCPVRNLELNRPVTGKLSEAGCRHWHVVPGSPNGAFADLYNFDVRRGGAFGVRTQLSWELFTPAYRRIPAAQSLQRGEYALMLESPRAGAHTFTAQLTPRTCPTVDLEAGATVTGTLSATDCRVSDLEDREDNSLVEQYRLHVRRRGSLNIEVRPDTFEWEFRGPSRSNLQPGDYTLWVKSSKPGSFTLTTRFRTACSPRSLALNTTVTGQLSSSDCRESDLYSGRPDNYLQQYAVSAERRGALRIRVRSQAFEPYVVFGGKTLPAETSLDLAPGTHHFEVAAQNGAVGAYSLTTAFGCPELALTPGQPASGVLAVTDCRVKDILGRGEDNSPAHLYRLVVSQAGQFRLDLQSPVFDSYLILTDANYRELATDDDGGGGRNARISRRMDPGTYFVVAKALQQAVGSYTLTASAASSCAARDLQLPATVSETLSTTDCRVRDILGQGTDDSYADQYRVTLKERGTLTLVLQSTAFDAYLILLDANLRQIATDDDSAGNRNARISRMMDPGTYVIVAKPFRPATGSYTLQADFRSEGVVAEAQIGPGERELPITIQGELTTSDRRVLDILGRGGDRTYADEYRITIRQPGTLTINLESGDFDPYLYLLDAKNQVVASDNNSGGGTNARIRQEVTPGVYTILANAFNVSTGRYSLRADFTPQGGTPTAPPRPTSPGCPARTLELNREVSGTFSSTACTVRQIVGSGTDSTPADQYRLTLTQRDSVTIDLRSPAFDPYLILLDGNYRELARDDDSGEGNSARITRTLEAGTYFVLAKAFVSGQGTYYLRASAAGAAGPAGVCAAQDLQLPANISGSLSATDCQVRNILGSGTDESRADQYRVAVPQRGRLSIELRSAAFDAYLILLDSNLREMATDDDSAGNRNARISTVVSPGTYIIVAKPYRAALGDYTLSAEFTPEGAPETTPGAKPTCSVGVLRLGQPVSGTLSESDCRVREILGRGDDSTRADQYRLTLPQSAAVTIDLRSTAFDAYLMLLDSNYAELATDDDSGGNRDARIVQNLDAGSYIVLVKPLSSGVGSYTLEARTAAQTGAACRTADLALNTQVSGALSATDCLLRDLVSGSSDDSYADPYRVVIPQRGTLTIDLRSSDIDAFLHLLEANRRQITTDDDSGSGHDARIIRELSPGTYIIVANSYRRALGRYTLRTAFAPLGAATPAPYAAAKPTPPPTAKPAPPPTVTCPAADIGLNATATGALRETDCRLRDILGGGDNSRADQYRLEITQRGTLTIDMRSTELDSFILLYRIPLQKVASDNDSGGGRNARIAQTLEPGRYLIIINSLLPGFGSYTLQTTFRPSQ